MSLRKKEKHEQDQKVATEDIYWAPNSNKQKLVTTAQKRAEVLKSKDMK